MTEGKTYREFWLGPNRNYDEPKYVVLNEQSDDESIKVIEYEAYAKQVELTDVLEDVRASIYKREISLEQKLATAIKAINMAGSSLEVSNDLKDLLDEGEHDDLGQFTNEIYEQAKTFNYLKQALAEIKDRK